MRVEIVLQTWRGVRDTLATCAWRLSLLCIVAAAALAVLGSPAWAQDGGVPDPAHQSDGGIEELDAGAAKGLTDAAHVDACAPPISGSHDDVAKTDDGHYSTVPVAIPSVAAPIAILRERPRMRSKVPFAGVDLDAGVSGVLPDTGILLAVRPRNWLHGQLGFGYNGIAAGVRSGATLVNPVAFPLSLTLECGHYFEGDANQAVHWFSSRTRTVASLQHFSYDYLNLLVGLVFEGQHLTFYIRGGVTWMRTTLRNFAQSVNDVTAVNLEAEDPKILYRGPSAKLGFIIFP